MVNNSYRNLRNFGFLAGPWFKTSSYERRTIENITVIFTIYVLVMSITRANRVNIGDRTKVSQDNLRFHYNVCKD